MLSGADAYTMELLRRRITALCTGWDVAQVRGDRGARRCTRSWSRSSTRRRTELIAEHRAQGDEIVVLSASGLEVVEPIAALVGADRCLATRMARRGRPLQRGDRDTTATARPRRRRRARIAAERGYRLADCRAYSDSITDLPLLEAVGHPTVVNPDRALRRVAAGARLAGADVRRAGRAAVAAAHGGRAVWAALAGAAALGLLLRTRSAPFGHPPNGRASR